MEMPKKVIKKKNFDKPLPSWFSGTGWSMFPTLLPGDVVRISAAPNGYEVGHVVAFFVQDKMMIHRIVSRGPSKGVWQLKGDSCVHFDPWIADSEIVGYINMVRRGNRLITLLTDKPLAKLSYKFATLFSKYLYFLSRRWARTLYLICFLPINIILKLVRLAASLHKPK